MADNSQLEQIASQTFGGGNYPNVSMAPTQSQDTPNALEQIASQTFQKRGDTGGEQDASDKLSTLGSLLQGGKLGIEEFMGRLGQLGWKGGEKLNLLKPGTAAYYTRSWNKIIKSDKDYQEALQKHPWAVKIGEFAGGILPLMATPVGEAGEAVAGVSKLIGGGEKLSKFLKLLGTGFAVGETNFDPTGHHILSAVPGVGGAAASLIPGLGYKGIEALGRPTAEMLSGMADKIGAKLTPYPKLQQYLSYLPFNSLKPQGEEIAEGLRKSGDNIIEEAGGPDSYKNNLSGELENSYKTHNKLYKENNKKILDKISENPENVKLKNFRQKLLDKKSELSLMPSSHQDPELMSDIDRHLSLPDLPYAQTDKIRRDIGMDVGNYNKGFTRGSVSPEKNNLCKGLYGSLNEDLKTHLKSTSPALSEAFEKNQEMYKNKVIPFNHGSLSKFKLANFDADKIVGQFLRKDQNKTAEQLLDTLPEGNVKGRASAQAALMHNALEAGRIGDLGMNAKKVVNRALKLDEEHPTIFSSEQKETLKGYNNLINYIEDIKPGSTNSAKITPPGWLTKKGITGIGVGGGAMGLGVHAGFSPILMGSLVLAGPVFGKIIGSKVGINALRQLSKFGIKAADAKKNVIVQRLMKIATKGSAFAGAKAYSNPDISFGKTE